MAVFLAAGGFDGSSVVMGHDGPERLADRLASCRLPSFDRMAAAASAQSLVDGLADLPRRDYSIASVPENGRLHLLIRQVRLPDGGLGLGSGRGRRAA